MKHILKVWRDDGVPANVPLMVTESHLAASLTGPMSTIFAGLWLADNMGSFFEGGGAAFYHSPIQPQPVQDTCFGLGHRGPTSFPTRTTTSTGYTSLYFAAQMINLEWAQHRSGVHQMFPSRVDVKDADGNALVTSYALHRPDGNWAIMLVNRDETQAHTVRVEFGASNSSTRFSGPVAVTTFGSEQYEWKADGVNSHADPDGPAVGFRVDAKPNTTFILPKASVTVLRGNVKAPSK